MRIWFFDFDGTLSPLVEDRNAAVLHPVCADLLKEISESPDEIAVVISSRILSDIALRIPIDEVIIGGNSGINWRLPGNSYISIADSSEDALRARRLELMPMIEKFGRTKGVEIEDKQWSLAVHMKKTGSSVVAKTVKTISTWARRENIPMFQGPNVLEIQFLQGFNKSIGASFIADFLNVNPQKDTIVYAGDDENDAVAMWWALMTGGTAIMVGTNQDVPGAVYVKDQQELVETVQALRKTR